MKIGDEITLPLDSIKKYGGNQTIAATIIKPAERVTESTSVNNNKTKIDSGNDRSSGGSAHSNQDEYATYTVEQGDTVFQL